MIVRWVVDAAKLIWPITGGWRLVWPHALQRTWPLLRWVAWAHRRVWLRRTRVIAVVGSVGKTTTKQALDGVLGPRVARHFLSNYGAGLALNLLRTGPHHPRAVFEIGIDGPGQMRRFARLVAPDVVVVTAIASDHHASFRTIEATRDEKAHMLRALSPRGVAVVNGDDPHVRWMATQTKARVLTYGFEPHNDVRASDVAIEWPRGTRFTLHIQGEQREVTTPLLGRHLVYPALAAAAVALEEGMGLEDLVERLAHIRPGVRRLAPMTLPNGAVLIRDEVKGSPETFGVALEMLGQIAAPRKLVVLGNVQELSSGSRNFYRALGRRVAEVADRAILVGNNRHLSLRASAAQAGMDRAAVTYVGSSVRAAAELLERELKPGDVVLIKGSLRQRLERIALHLEGRRVQCAVTYCKVALPSCADCPLLSRNGQAVRNVYVQHLTRCEPAAEPA